jgi:predicted membrane chloride channel (bestrophin family)
MLAIVNKLSQNLGATERLIQTPVPLTYGMDHDW